MMNVFLVLICILFAVSSITPAVDGGVYETVVIGQGERWETELYILSGEEEGPTAFFVGGIHGSEPAGTYALEEMLTELDISRGRVLLLPRANSLALDEGRRYPVGGSDLNRAFDVDYPETWTEELAMDILRIVQDYGVDIVLDLHESVNYHWVSNHVGQTVIFNDHPDAPFLALHLVTEINKGIDDDLQRFTYIGPTAQGSLTRVVCEQMDIPTFIFETTRIMDLQDRIDLHKELVWLTLGYLGILE